jgi:hypothetical protein
LQRSDDLPCGAASRPRRILQALPPGTVVVRLRCRSAAAFHRREWPPQLVIPRKRPAIAMPVLRRRRTRSVSAAKAEAVEEGDAAEVLRDDLIERRLLRPTPLLAAGCRGAAMGTASDSRGKPCDHGDHGRTGWWTAEVNGCKSTRPGANGVVELSPPRVPRPARRHVKAGGSLCDAQPPPDGAHTVFHMSDRDRWAGREPWHTEPDRTGQRGAYGCRRAAAVRFGKNTGFSRNESCLQPIPFLPGYPGLPQYPAQQVASDVAAMWVGNRKCEIPAYHEGMLPPLERTLETRLAEGTHEIAAGNRSERWHQDANSLRIVRS